MEIQQRRDMQLEEGKEWGNREHKLEEGMDVKRIHCAVEAAASKLDNSIFRDALIVTQMLLIS